MVSSRPLISKSSSPCTNPSVTVPRAPIIIVITVTFMFLSFFNSLARSRYLSLFAFFQFYPKVNRNDKVHYSAGSLFLLTITRSGHLAEIRWSFCILKSFRSLCVPFSMPSSGLYIYHLFVWSNLSFLHNSQWITLPPKTRPVLYSFCANLLHSLIMWLTVSSLSPQNLHLLFSYVLSIFALE